MIRSNLRWAIVGIIVAMLGIACSKANTDRSAASDIRNEANASLDKADDAIDDAAIAMHQQMDQLRQEMGDNLASADAKLQELEEKRDNMADAEAKESLDARLTRLKNDRDALQLRIDRMDSQDDQTNWEQFQKETRSAWHDLENGVKDAIDSLGF